MKINDNNKQRNGAGEPGSNVVTINVDLNNETTESNKATLDNKKRIPTMEVKHQRKIFSVLLMVSAVLLFFALISHTSKDASNLQIKVGDLFSIFSDDPAIKLKFDTTINMLGLFGAFISDLLINGTIGIWIIGVPVCLFIWGLKSYKTAEISEHIIQNTNYYLVIAAIAACFVGALSNFNAFQNIPLMFYGTIGAFIGTTLSNIISPIGTSILMLSLLILTITKLTNIINAVKQKGIAKVCKIFIRKINIFNLIDFINKKQGSPASPDNPEFPVGAGKHYDDCAGVPLENTITNSADLQPQTPDSKLKDANNDFIQPQIKPKSNYKSNAIITLKSTHNNNRIKLKQGRALDQISPLSAGLQLPDNNADLDCHASAKQMTGRDDYLGTTLAAVTDEILPLDIDFNKNISRSAEAEFTYEPPKNLELPQQKVYPQPPTRFSPWPDKPTFGGLETIQLAEKPDTNIEYSESNSLNYNNPVKIDFKKPDTRSQNMKLQGRALDQISPNFLPERENTITTSAGLQLSNLIRNPLCLAIHDETINYKAPGTELLKIIEDKNIVSNDELHKNGRILQEKLSTFKIDISDLTAIRGPVVTQYEFILADGVKLNKIEVLADDLAMALKTKSVIITPLPEKGSVGVQIPNSKPSIVSFRSVVESNEFKNSGFELPLALGKTVQGEPYIADLAKMPHLLMAGATGSGKSVGINSIIASLLYKKLPYQLKFIIIDPKKVELSQYARLSNHFIATLPNLNSEIVTDPKDAVTILKSATLEMEKRYSILEAAGQRNIKDYNEKVRAGATKSDSGIDHREFPYIVVIIDELADLMLTAGKEVEKPIVRLAQMARAVGIHLIIATQRPSVNVITGVIKANFPVRIAYLVAQKIDSRVILDSTGAEALLGNGDMLFHSSGQKELRLQSPFISTDEVETICDFIGNQEGFSAPYFLPFVQGRALDQINPLSAGLQLPDNNADYESRYNNNDTDPLLYEAAELVINMKMASISGLQRSLKIGFARAGRIIDELAKLKVIGPQQGSKPREVLVQSISELDKVFTLTK